MRTTLRLAVAATVLFFSSNTLGQAPELGSTKNFVLFTSSGAVGNTGISHITGDIGTQIGAITAFGNIDGAVQNANAATALAVTDLTALYTQLNATITTDTHAAVMGTGEVLSPGVYQIAAAGSIAGTLTLDAGGDENALFIIKIGGAFTTGAGTEVILANNAKACNVFWVAEGAIGMAANTTMKGTLIANNDAIALAAGGQLEGRMFSTAGAVAIDGTTARLPLGCELPVLNGPAAPSLGTTECFALFTANGALTNTAVTTVTGDVGTDMGATTGFVAEYVDGTLHLTPNAITASCASDLELLTTYLGSLPIDIELLYPATVGNKLVLTPHTYLMDAATVISDTLFLNAQNNADAVFVLMITGALTTSVGATVALLNGAQAENVFWLVNGNVSLNTDAIFVGTIISDNGTVDLAMGTDLVGRVLTTNGDFTTDNITVEVPTMCSTIGLANYAVNTSIELYPNPFEAYIMIDLSNSTVANAVQFYMYNVVGEKVLDVSLNAELNKVDTGSLPSGIYLYTIIDQNGTEQTGRLVSM